MIMFRQPPNLVVSQGERSRVFPRNYQRVLILVVLAAAIVAPFTLTSYHTHLLNLALIASMGALSLNMLTGLTGQVSLGHAAFLAIGGFSAAIVESATPVGIWLSVPLAGAAGGLVGLLVGMPGTRFRGLYLAISTLAMHYAIIFAAKWYQVELGASASEGIAIPDPQLFGHSLSGDRSWYFVLLALLVLTTWVFLNLLRSRIGRAWIAVRDRDISAEALGINIFRAKLSAFVVSSAITSMVGAILAYYTNSVSSDNYTIDIAVTYLAMIIIGGMGSPMGAILGAFFVTFLPYSVEGLMSYAPVSWRAGGALFAYQVGAVGLFILLFIVLEPRGLVEVWRRIETYFERWPFKYRALDIHRR